MNKVEIQTHEFYMKKSIELAKIAKQRGDSPVGSVVVRNDKILGEGIEGNKTHNDITYHAEIEAIRNAIKKLNTQDLSDCTLYTTHEPCIMCSYLIRHTKLKMVITGRSTGEVGGFSSHYPLLLDNTITRWGNPPILIKGVLENECQGL